MAYEKTIKGIGTVTAGGTRYENVAYSITVSNTGRTISGAGELNFEEDDQAFSAFNKGPLVLALQGNAGDLELVPTSQISPGTRMGVSTSGKIPGF